jgi:hypothetical protein
MPISQISAACARGRAHNVSFIQKNSILKAFHISCA